MDDIPFNKPFLVGKELEYIKEAVLSGKISGDGLFTKKCREFFSQHYKFQNCFLTTSCTDALEMSALLANIQPGDEVIIPSYTFVSTANAFVLRGAKIIFADSETETPNIDAQTIEALITGKTKAIIPVHYAGIACDMNLILDIADRHRLFVIEDAAQAIDSFFNGKPLGSLGQFGAFSFHETKNISSGEGGMLSINDKQYIERAEIVREKGTNRSAFFRGEIDKYGWVDIGSSFLPSDIIAAFLYAQIEHLDEIQKKRKRIWNLYFDLLAPFEALGVFCLPHIPEYATNNAHMFYLVCNCLEERTDLINHLKRQGIMAVFHYQSLHRSPYYKDLHDGRNLKNSDRYTDCLVRLPLYYELTESKVEFIAKTIKKIYTQK
jgi:dTDP-4-amino-4,6-dideoxygalactose transaminase